MNQVNDDCLLALQFARERQYQIMKLTSWKMCHKFNNLTRNAKTYTPIPPSQVAKITIFKMVCNRIFFFSPKATESMTTKNKAIFDIQNNRTPAKELTWMVSQTGNMIDFRSWGNQSEIIRELRPFRFRGNLQLLKHKV